MSLGSLMLSDTEPDDCVLILMTTGQTLVQYFHIFLFA